MKVIANLICGKHFIIYMHQIIVLYTLNLHMLCVNNIKGGLRESLAVHP